jgi:tetratricopeptide (TPR) repeat protein
MGPADKTHSAGKRELMMRKLCLAFMFLHMTTFAAANDVEVLATATCSEIPQQILTPSATFTLTPLPLQENLKAKALLTKAQAEPDLNKAREYYLAAAKKDPDGFWGRSAVFEQGRMEYAMGDLNAALKLWESLELDTTPLQIQPELLFWRAQARMALNGIQKAGEEFRLFLTRYKDHPLRDAAVLGAADCARASKKYGEALTAYESLWQNADSPAAAHALWQAASIHTKTGRAEEANRLYGRLVKDYPDSFEGRQAAAKWIPPKDTPAPTRIPPAVKTKSGGGFTIQVGAFTRKNVGVKLVERLKKKRYSARLEHKEIHETLFYVVKVGNFADGKSALKFAERLAVKEKLPYRVVEE